MIVVSSSNYKEHKDEGKNEKKNGEAPGFRTQRKSKVTCCLEGCAIEVLSPANRPAASNIVWSENTQVTVLHSAPPTLRTDSSPEGVPSSDNIALRAAGALARPILTWGIFAPSQMN